MEYTDFRNLVAVIAKAREACANSGHTVSDHFVEITEMVPIGSGAQRPVEDWALSRYACYLVIQNADPGKPLSSRPTYFAPTFALLALFAFKTVPEIPPSAKSAVKKQH